MARYQVILAYDGTPFQGFQRQRNALTVQGVVEQALRQLGWKGNSILAAGRTDTGVHAWGQVIAFDLDWEHPAEALRSALNAHLPPEVVARFVRPVHERFHPRYDALRRRYCYRIYSQETRNPFLERYAWRVWPPLETEILQRAADYLLGRHDFAAFGTPLRAGSSTVRTVFQAQWVGKDDELIFDIIADAFLYRMVRRLVHVQVEIGRGQDRAETILRYLETPPPFPLQGLAPAHGLTLMEVEYPPQVLAASGEERTSV